MRTCPYLRNLFSDLSLNKLSREEFLSRRPDFYLGRYFSMFSDLVFQKNLKLKLEPDQKLQTEIEKDLSLVLMAFFNGFSNEFFTLSDYKNPSCLTTAKEMLAKSYETFIDLITYSQLGIFIFKTMSIL